MTSTEQAMPFGARKLGPWRNGLRRMAGKIRPQSAVASSVFRKLSLLGFTEPVDVEPWDGFRTRLYPAQNHTDKYCFLGLDFSGNAGRNFMEPAINDCPDRLFYFLDIGANSGCYSILAHLAAIQMGAKAHILAIEANPVMLERLQFNLDASGIRDYQACGVAVSDQKGHVHLDIDVRNLGQANIISGKAAGNNCVDVPADTLANIVATSGFPRIDFMKIDIEGHEITALEPYMKNAEITLLPRVVLAETVHDREDSLKTLLTGMGYSIKNDDPVDTVFVLDKS